MRDLLTIVPTRERPGNAWRLINAFHETTDGQSDLLFVLDGDDARMPEYMDLNRSPGVSFMILSASDQHGLPRALNMAALDSWDRYRCLAFMGDDHLPRTPLWDVIYVRTLLEDLAGVGVVYGDDLIHGAAIPTQVAMTANIPRTLGYFCPPGFRHLFLDNVWKLWGEGIGRLKYLPEVVIEHLHPIAGKAPRDAGYERVNADVVHDADREAWGDYQDYRWPAVDRPALLELAT
jgi:hypothetical protein